MTSENPAFHDHLIRVTYRDTDQMGFSYYGNYFTYMEIGRTEYLRVRGLPYVQLEERGLLLPVLHASCDYHRPGRYDDLLRIRTSVEQATRVRLNLHYEVYCDARNEHIATGSTRHAFMSPDGRPRRCPQEVIDTLLGPPNASS
ncbi:acyl-CoA thioesterase [bacterium]|nr:acyl-CoA thioesterase [bacterium]